MSSWNGNAKAIAAKQPGTAVDEHELQRRQPSEHDVAIDIEACGVCHTDVHFVKNDLGASQYPLVPGHEIIGRVAAVGSKVQNFSVGDNVGVGCMVDSCEECSMCKKGEEQYCANGHTPTYGGVAKNKHVPQGEYTSGGYSTKITVYERFCVKLPKELTHEQKLKMAPVLCAGITTYDPLRYYGVTSGWRVGVLGLGGLGQTAIKLARKLGATVTAISSSPGKKEKAFDLGADDFIVNDNPENFKVPERAGTVDIVLDTVSAPHDVRGIMDSLLGTEGKLVTLGIVTEDTFNLFNAMMIFKRKALVGNLIGGMPRTQEVCDFCYKHDVYPDTKVIKPDPKQVSDVLAHLDSKNSDPIRYVIDWQSGSN